jgi:hypothetical protein
MIEFIEFESSAEYFSFEIIFVNKMKIEFIIKKSLDLKVRLSLRITSLKLFRYSINLLYSLFLLKHEWNNLNSFLKE